MSTPNKKRKLSTTNDEDDDLEALFDYDQTTKWNLIEKLNDLTRYNASYVQFLNAKGLKVQHQQKNFLILFFF